MVIALTSGQVRGATFDGHARIKFRAPVKLDQSAVIFRTWAFTKIRMRRQWRPHTLLLADFCRN